MHVVLTGVAIAEVGLEGEDVGSGARVGNFEEGLVELPVAFEVPVPRLQAGADLGDAQGLEEEGFAVTRPLSRRAAEMPSELSLIMEDVRR